MEQTPTVESASARWLTTLQQDVKDFLHVIVDDQDLDEPLRARMIATVLYLLSPADVVPDSQGTLGYIDDALAIRVALDAVRVESPARWEAHRERLGDMASTLDADLGAFRAMLGELYPAFCERVMGVTKNEYKGKRAKDLLGDEGTAWLDDEVTVKALSLDFKPSDVQSASRRVATVLPTFRQKLGASRR